MRTSASTVEATGCSDGEPRRHKVRSRPFYLGFYLNGVETVWQASCQAVCDSEETTTLRKRLPQGDPATDAISPATHYY